MEQRTWSQASGILSIGVAVWALAISANAVSPSTNQAPIGHIEKPVPGAVHGNTHVVGWAVDMDGKIIRMELLLDGQTVQELEQTIERPDVCDARPNPGCPTVGFSVQVDFSTITQGPHTLSVRVTDDDNETLEIERVRVVVQ